MSFYDDMRAVADELLTEFAQGTVTLTRTTQTAAANAWDAPTESDESETLSAVVRGVTAQFVDGQEILATDLMATIKVPATEPALADVVTIDGVPMTILRIDRIPAAGTVSAYRLFLRR